MMFTKICNLILFLNIVLSKKEKDEIYTFTTTITAKYYLLEDNAKPIIKETEFILNNNKFNDSSNLIIWNRFLIKPYLIKLNGLDEEFFAKNNAVVYVESSTEILFSIVKNKEPPFNWEIDYNPSLLFEDETNLNIRKINLPKMNLFEMPQFLKNSVEYIKQMNHFNKLWSQIEKEFKDMFATAIKLENSYLKLLEQEDIKEFVIFKEVLEHLLNIKLRKYAFRMPSLLYEKSSSGKVYFNKGTLSKKINKIKTRFEDTDLSKNVKFISSLMNLESSLNVIEEKVIELEKLLSNLKTKTVKYERTETLTFSELFDIDEEEFLNLFDGFYHVLKPYEYILQQKMNAELDAFYNLEARNNINVKKFYYQFVLNQKFLWFIKSYTKTWEDPNASNIDKGYFHLCSIFNQIVSDLLYNDIKSKFDIFIEEKQIIAKDQITIDYIERSKIKLTEYKQFTKLLLSALSKYNHILHFLVRFEPLEKLYNDIDNELNHINELLESEKSKTGFRYSKVLEEPNIPINEFFKESESEKGSPSESLIHESTTVVQYSTSKEEGEDTPKEAINLITNDETYEKEKKHNGFWTSTNLILVSLIVVISGGAIFFLVKLVRQSS